jgi:hypothetical protein
MGLTEVDVRQRRARAAHRVAITPDVIASSAAQTSTLVPSARCGLSFMQRKHVTWTLPAAVPDRR